MKTNKLDNFEEFINKTMNSKEVPYNPEDWTDLSKRLDNLSPKSKFPKKWFLGGAAAVVLVAGTIVVNQDQNTEEGIHKEITETVQLKEKEQNQNERQEPVDVVEISEVKIEQEETEKSFKEANTISKQNIIQPSETQPNEGEEISENKPVLTEKPKTSPSFNKDSQEIEAFNKDGFEGSVEKPKAPLYVQGETSGCPGLTVRFDTDEQQDVFYLWSFGDGTYSNEKAPKHTYEKPGVYSVNLIVQSKKDKNVVTKSSEEPTVTVYEIPEVEINKNIDMDKGMSVVTYSVNGNSINSIQWQFEDGTTSKELAVSYAYKRRGNHIASLSVESIEGCKNQIKDVVFIENDYNLLAPNTFSPNGDGLNDFFIPVALKDMNVSFTMVVQDRRGNIVFKTSSANNPWDGRDMNTGMKAPEANYIWFVQLVNEKGQQEQYKGEVLIRRN